MGHPREEDDSVKKKAKDVGNEEDIDSDADSLGGPDRKASDGSPLVLIQGPRGLVAMKRAEVASVMKEKKMLERELNKARWGFSPSWPAVGKLRPSEVISNQTAKSRYPKVEEMVLVEWDVGSSTQVLGEEYTNRRDSEMTESDKTRKRSQLGIEGDPFDRGKVVSTPSTSHLTRRARVERWNTRESQRVEDRMNLFNKKHDSWMLKNPGLYKRPSWKGRGFQLPADDPEVPSMKLESKTEVTTHDENDGSPSNGLSFGASMAKSLYLGLSSFNNFLRSMGEERNNDSEGAASENIGIDEETKRNLMRQKMQLDALLKDPSALDASVYGADGSLRTIYTLPSLSSCVKEAGTARYLRSKDGDKDALDVRDVFERRKRQSEKIHSKSDSRR